MTNTAERKMTTPWKLGIAAVAAVGLAFTGMSPAFAATINVGDGDVQPVEMGDPASGDGVRDGYNYHQWHMGHVGPGNDVREPTSQELALGNSSFDFEDPAGITLYGNAITGGTGAETQLLKGYHIVDLDAGEQIFDAAGFRTFLEGVSVNLASGVDMSTGGVHLQIAGKYNGSWTTIRPSDAHGSSSALGLTGLWTGSGTFPSTDDTLENILNDMALTSTNEFQVFGVGVVVTGEATVSSISFGGDTYNFAAPVPVVPVDPGTPGAPTPPAAVETAAK